MIIFGFGQMYNFFKRNFKNTAKNINVFYFIIIFLSLISFSIIINYGPHFERYTNPLMGKHSEIVTQYGDMPAIGLMEAADYLNQKEGINNMVIAAWYPQIFYLECKGQVTSLNYFMYADYVVFYRNQVDREYFLDIYSFYIKNLKPEYVVTFKDVEYVWIYHNNNEVKSFFEQAAGVKYK